MSDGNSARWLERFAFGYAGFRPRDVPPELVPLAGRLHVAGVDLPDLMRNGGFSGQHLALGRDHERLMRYVRDGGDDPVFETSAVASLFNGLSVAAGRNLRSALVAAPDAAGAPSSSDWDVLGALLRGEEASGPFADARFWGTLVAELLGLRRPFEATALPAPSAAVLRDACRVYDVACRARGRRLDPFSMVMVPREDHVDASHWRTPEAFRNFLRTRGDHPLALSTRDLVVGSVLEARPDDLPEEWNLRTFLTDVRRASVREVAGDDVPPKLVDVFHRLLVELGRDSDYRIGPSSPGVVHPARAHLDLFVRVQELERQNAVLSAMASSSRTSESPAQP